MKHFKSIDFFLLKACFIETIVEVYIINIHIYIDFEKYLIIFLSSEKIKFKKITHIDTYNFKHHI